MSDTPGPAREWPSRLLELLGTKLYDDLVKVIDAPPDP
jgi:hypothetical protein